MKKINVAINGFGRIGRAAAKIILSDYPKLRLVAINDLSDVDTLAHLFVNDSVYGKYPKKVNKGKDFLQLNNQKILVTAIREPEQLPWEKLKVDVVLECTGRFRTPEELAWHLEAGAKKVVLSAPARASNPEIKPKIKTSLIPKKIKSIVLGVNEEKLKASDNIVSCASCTTNCLAPTTAVLRKHFGIKKALMSTVHAYTADQNLVDGSHKDLRRARAAAINIVPTSTGAATATTEVIPSLAGSFDGLALRVPIPVGSLCDSVYLLNKKTTLEKIKEVFKKEASGALRGIIELSEEELVSSDIVANPHSAIVDIKASKLVDGDLLKLITWYDNEWAYANRLVELSAYQSQFL